MPQNKDGAFERPRKTEEHDFFVFVFSFFLCAKRCRDTNETAMDEDDVSSWIFPGCAPHGSFPTGTTHGSSNKTTNKGTNYTIKKKINSHEQENTRTTRVHHMKRRILPKVNDGRRDAACCLCFLAPVCHIGRKLALELRMKDRNVLGGGGGGGGCDG